jgi:hypothetical protein
MCYEWFERKSLLKEKLEKGKQQALNLARLAAEKARAAKVKQYPQKPQPAEKEAELA